MNDNTNFKTMLNMIWDMQVSVMTVEFLNEKLFGDKWCMTHHIIVPSGKDKITDFCFVAGRSTNNNYLYSVNHVDMSFGDAVIEFSKLTLKDQGTKLTLISI